MQGYIYSFEIFVNEINESIKETTENCRIFPYFTNNCLSVCDFNQFDSNGSCETCDNLCIFGCVNKTNCNTCQASNCRVCNNFDIYSCYDCNLYYELADGRCKACEGATYYNFSSRSCENCSILCSSCTNINKCQKCIDNSKFTPNFSCACFFGFKEQNGVCKQMTFKASLKIDQTNLISISFSEQLLSPSQLENITTTINSQNSSFSAIVKNSSFCEINLEIPKKLANTKSLYLKLSLPHDLKSTKGSVLNQTIFNFKLFKPAYKKDSQTIKNLQSSAKTITIVSAATAISSGAFLMNPTIIFDLLNLVEMFYYSILFDLKFDYVPIKCIFFENIFCLFLKCPCLA